MPTNKAVKNARPMTARTRVLIIVVSIAAAVLLVVGMAIFLYIKNHKTAPLPQFKDVKISVNDEGNEWLFEIPEGVEYIRVEFSGGLRSGATPLELKISAINARSILYESGGFPTGPVTVKVWAVGDGKTHSDGNPVTEIFIGPRGNLWS